jgi:tRNA-specific 2-thiouridylase
MPRVVLAMSGGVDSSASAVLLKRQGYDVVGLFMRTGTHGHGEPGASATGARADHKKGCCSAIDAGDARRVADKLDIPFYALDFEAEFSRIIDYFADEYVKGRTPNPCVVCNNWLKFGQLWAFGQKLGADFIATGHYARVINGELHKGVDTEKDQSYVLHGIKRDVLPHLLFPVGGYTKPEIRQFAREAGLVGVAEKSDSVEICFVPSGNHTDVVRARRPEAALAGVIAERDGTVLGEHDGIDRYTVGQR